MRLPSPQHQQSVASQRYAENQVFTNTARLRRGMVGLRVPDISGPDFSDRLRQLLPPERRMSSLDRTLTGRAAESLARQRPVAPTLPGEGRNLDVFVADGGPRSVAAHAAGEPPRGAASAQVPAARLLGLAQRALGVPIDTTLAAGLSFLGRDPLSATRLRPDAAYLARRADQAYRRLAA